MIESFAIGSLILLTILTVPRSLLGLGKLR